MAKKNDSADNMQDGPIVLGPVEIPVQALTALAPESYSKNGVVLLNERTKFTVRQADQKIGYTISIYVSRGPIDQDEANEIATVTADRRATAAEKEQTEQTKREREVKAAFDLGQTATLGALGNIHKLVGAAEALNMVQGRGNR